LKISGREPSADLEGKVLPGLGGNEEVRSLYSMEAKECSAFGNLHGGVSLSMIKDEYKLIYYTGYGKHPDTFELYNLKDDVEEMKDLYSKRPKIASLMKEELLANFEAKRSLS
jgi:hypothetical protein